MDHDHSYKLLFSHARLVEDLLRGFVSEPWVQELDFATLERVMHSQISADLQEQEDDVIWRVRFRGQWLYIYLILEFQSRVDSFMAVRFLTYIGLLYEGLIRAKQTHDHLCKEHPLPPGSPAGFV